MNKFILFFLVLFITVPSAFSQVMMPLPAHGSVYTGSARGYWFTAPVSFTITGLRVSADAGAGVQSIHVIKCNDPFPIAFGTQSANFVTLSYINNAPNGVIQNVSINVNVGDVIGILGTVNASTNSYSVAGPHTTTIGGNTVNLNRLGYQGAINTAAAPLYWGEANAGTGQISRVEMYYLAGPACNAPTGLTASGITHTSANTSWSAVTGATGYQYAVTTSSTPPATGTATTGTTYNAPGLTPGTTHYLHVRTQCAASTFSSWATYSFTTLSCATPTGLTSSGVTSNSATFNWTAVAGAMGYEYAITSSTTPPTSGSMTATTTYTAPGLSPNTNYCLHVRTQCAPGVYSAWSNTCVTTLAPPPCPGPDTLNASNITFATADLYWNALATAVRYEYAVSNNPAPPSSGTPITTNTYNVTGLTFATQYYAHVRAECNAGLFSAWKTVPFNTPFPPCDSPRATLSNITNESADVNWTTVPYGLSYQVAVFSNPNPPNISGVPTTGLNYHATNLVSGKLYYVHLRTICAFDTSGWASSSFYSEVPASVPSLGGSATITVYPNPVKDVLNVKLDYVPNQNAQISVTDITGRFVKVVPVAEKELLLDMKDIPTGVYLLKYADDDRQETFKIFKE